MPTAMCIRYQLENSALKVWAGEFWFETQSTPTEQGKDFFPGSTAGVIATNQDSKKIIINAYWGLIPAWAKDLSFGKKSTYNARSETAQSKPSFKNSFKKYRCLIPATAFYERHAGSWIKFHKNDSSVFAMAGLYEPANKVSPIASYTILTTTPNELISSVHDRMPVILESALYEDWLSTDTSADNLQAMLKPCPRELLSASTL
jgi:putative SOS response-associated peptidase YedK